jgi:hypothetical protein
MSLVPLRRIVLVPHRIIAEVGNRFGERRQNCSWRSGPESGSLSEHPIPIRSQAIKRPRPLQ